MDKRNIYFVISHPIQYFVPLYRFIASQDEVNVKVLFCTDETIKGSVDSEFGIQVKWDIPLLEGYLHKFMRNYSPLGSISKGFFGIFNPGIVAELWRLPKGVVVISGWQYATYILAFVFAHIFGHRVAIRCEAPEYKEIKRAGVKNALREFFISRILLKRLVHSCLYLGTQNKAFYTSKGVAYDKLAFAPYSIDDRRFSEQITQLNKSLERKKLNLGDEQFVILFTGKFIPVKRPLDLLKAFKKFNYANKALLMVGEGELKTDMGRFIEEEGLMNVHLPGFINQTEIVRYYCIADVLVLCSESETWGLSVNEAMVCGLPVIISDSVGCGDDLVQQGRNGFIVPKGDIDSLAQALLLVAEDKKRGGHMGKQSLEIVKDYSIANTAKGILSVLNTKSQT